MSLNDQGVVGASHVIAGRKRRCSNKWGARSRGMRPRKFGEFETEVGVRCDINSLKNALSLSTIDDFKFCGIIVFFGKVGTSINYDNKLKKK